MRKIQFTGTLVLLLVFSNLSFGQDFSNKGKDFWVGYGFHERMTAGGGGTQNMVLYFATEAATSVTVEIPGTGYSQTYNIPANTIYTSQPIPKTGAHDARLNQEGVSNKGIHITATKPIVAYAHIYNESVSGATLLFPTNTLGKEYYSINYDQLSNTSNSNSWFYAIAVDPGTTTVEITPSQSTLTRPAGIPYTVTLQQGQIINVMGTVSGPSGDIYKGADLTGSRIRSISTGTEGCKRLAVFSGSGRVAIFCDGVGTGQKSSDNYMVQAFPKTAWGKTYLTAPTVELTNNIFRIAVDDPTTVVRLNGQVLTNLRNNFYYEIGPLNQPAKIESDKPVMVAQYISTGRYCGNTRSGNLGDPEVIYLSPIEQTINKVILNSTPNFRITQHHINVTIPSAGTAISSFRLDGMPVSGFTPHPQNPDFSYASFSVSAGQHVLQSDSGFSAIAYGYGDYESYGYNAGANVKDLYQFMSVSNQYATVDFPAACKNDPFNFSMTFPYQPTRIEWRFNGLFPDVIDDNPTPVATSVVNGRTLYKYALAGDYSTAVTGTYPIKVIAENPTADGCNGIQEIDYDLEVFDKPTAGLNFSTLGCVTAPVSFTGTAAGTNNRPITTWSFDLGDGNTNTTGSSISHTYTTAGSYNVKYSFITDMGCKSDTASETVVLTEPPVAGFTVDPVICAGQTVNFTNTSSAPGGTTLTQAVWNMGTGGGPITTAGDANASFTFNTPGTYTVTLRVTASGGCQSIEYSQQVTVNPAPVAQFSLPDAVCLPGGAATFTSQSTISDGTQSSFVYNWNFGDGSQPGTGSSPTHIYSAVGTYQVEMQVTSGAGCSSSITKTLNNIYEEPQAAFAVADEVCLGNSITLTDQSTAANATVTTWRWDFGDGTTSIDRNPTKTYAAPGTYTVTLNVISDKGCGTVTKFATREVKVMELPVADFDILQAACEGRGVSFQSRATSADGNIIKWSWDFGNGTAIRNDASAFEHVYANTGNYQASLVVETDKGCISTAHSLPVTVHPNPEAAFDPPVICVNDVNAPFADASSISAGTISFWEWNFGDPNANATNPNSFTGQNTFHHYVAPGNYTATLIAGSAAGCRDTTQRTFTVNGGVITPAFTVEQNGPLCSNQELSIRDNSSIDAGQVIRVVIHWDPNDPSAITVDDAPAPGRVYTHRYPEFSSPATRVYRVRYQVFSGITCVETYEQDITLLASPVLSVAAVVPICSDAPAFQLSASTGNAMSGTGVFSGPGTSATGLFTPSLAGAGQHDILYQFTATNGCSAGTTSSVVVNPTPVTDAGPDKVVLEGGSVQLTPTLITDYPVNYEWTPIATLDNPNTATPMASPVVDTRYRLTITSEFGCSTSDDVLVKVLLAPVIPNIFSPNGDGINDRWEIEHLESYPGCVIQLFNRYGQMVHKIVNYSSPWDGRINGKDAPVGTYYYIIDPRNGRKPITGYVDIIR